MAIQQRVNIHDFEAFLTLSENDDRLFELIDGEIVEKMPTQEHGYLTKLISAKIFNYLESNPIGIVVVETRHQMPEDEHNAYIPDIAFTTNERSAALVIEGAVAQMPDLVVEIKSPNDIELKMRKKALYYLENGTRLVWLVFPRRKQIEVHTAETIAILTIDDVLEGGDVLPGFTLPVKTIFARQINEGL